MVGTYSSLSDFYLDSEYAQFPQEHRQGGAFGVSMLRAEQEAHAFTDPAVPALSMVAALRGSGYAKFDFGNGWQVYEDLPSEIVDLQPAHQVCRFQIEQPHTVLVASLQSDVVRQKLDDAGIRGDPFERLYGRMRGRDGQIAVLRSMWQAMQVGGPANDLYVDGCVIALLGMFCRAAGPDNDLPLPPVLDDPRLGRVIDFIEDHYAERIVMDDLAKVASMSTIHFSRAFKKAVGMSPHAFLTQRRLERAKALLKRSKLSVTEIAFATGFGSSAHFASVFSRKVGAPPSVYRSNT